MRACRIRTKVTISRCLLESESPIIHAPTKEYGLRLERNAQPLVGSPHHRAKPFDLTRIHYQFELLRYGCRIEDVKACPAHGDIVDGAIDCGTTFIEHNFSSPLSAKTGVRNAEMPSMI
jgi:hypothetical protein